MNVKDYDLSISDFHDILERKKSIIQTWPSCRRTRIHQKCMETGIQLMCVIILAINVRQESFGPNRSVKFMRGAFSCIDSCCNTQRIVHEPINCHFQSIWFLRRLLSCLPYIKNPDKNVNTLWIPIYRVWSKQFK